MRMSVSIFTPNAFSMRSAMSPGKIGFAVQQTGKSGARDAQCRGGGRYGKACGLNNFCADKISGVRRVLHRHGGWYARLNNRLRVHAHNVTSLTFAAAAAFRRFESVVANGKPNRIASTKYAAS